MKYQRVYGHLREQISNGVLGDGARLPTEVELAESFGASRPTVARALNQLEAEGLVSRRAGSGSFVTLSGEKVKKRGSKGGVQAGTFFGLLIHGIGHTEIFEPMCAAIAAEAEKDGRSLRWSSGASDDPDLVQTCRRLIRDKVDGVFFAPVEFDDRMREKNQEIIRALKDAGVTVVLLDRDYLPYPGRSDLDLVGLQNYRAGYALGMHLVERGARRVDFIARPGSAATVRQRCNGVMCALLDSDLIKGISPIRLLDPTDVTALQKLAGKWRKERTAVVGANDITAGELLNSLHRMGFRVPGDVLVGSFDDVRYAKLLRPGLTSVRQPVGEMGRLAYHAMVTRLEKPDLPAREIRVEGELVVRGSTGGEVV